MPRPDALRPDRGTVARGTAQQRRAPLRSRRVTRGAPATAGGRRAALPASSRARAMRAPRRSDSPRRRSTSRRGAIRRDAVISVPSAPTPARKTRAPSRRSETEEALDLTPDGHRQSDARDEEDRQYEPKPDAGAPGALAALGPGLAARSLEPDGIPDRLVIDDRDVVGARLTVSAVPRVGV